MCLLNESLLRLLKTVDRNSCKIMQQHLAGEDSDLPIQRQRLRPDFASWLSSCTIPFGMQVDHSIHVYICVYTYDLCTDGSKHLDRDATNDRHCKHSDGFSVSLASECRDIFMEISMHSIVVSRYSLSSSSSPVPSFSAVAPLGHLATLVS